MDAAGEPCEPYEAIGLSLSGRYILLTDDTTVPIVMMLDRTGEETTDESACVAVIWERKEKTYSIAYVSDFVANDLLIELAS